VNRLSREKSPYLRHAANQKIDWYPWSEEAFQKALKDDKPVFLSSGAIWCHWCHVMAKECFENEEISKLLNENFVNIKLDRDERPDIDRRYQNAVAAMGFGSGWPLSVFLTPDKIPFFGGTYFPPEDGPGRPGFRKVLRAVADFFHSRREAVDESGQKLLAFLKTKPLIEEELRQSAIHNALTDILSQFDTKNGGFGSSPKFPSPGAIQFLMSRYYFNRLESVGYIIKKTLYSMAKGGFHDQIGGGFHRYSVDEAWIIPHFEKMADDNAWHLRNYIDAYCVFGDEYFREVSEGIISFIRETLSDPEGGFYASQDADVTPEDEGGYFTWTDEEFRRVLNEEEYSILSPHLLNERGEMHYKKSKKVLFISKDAGEISKITGINIKKVSEIIQRGKKKLLKERETRTSPIIDRTFYTSLNSMLITAYLKAFRVLKDKYLKDFALKSLKRIMKIQFVLTGLLHTEGIEAVLDDYIYLIEAIIAAYEVTGDSSYLTQADKLMGLCIKKFWDEREGGFFDTEKEVLGIRLKGIEDIPHPSPNAIGVIVLLKLYFMTDNTQYKTCAETILKIFSSNARDMGVHAGYYFSALDAYYHMIKLTVEADPESSLAGKIFSTFNPHVSLVYGENRGRIIPCLRELCFEPIESPEHLEQFLRSPQSYPNHI
jgi:hypothetical protein